MQDSPNKDISILTADNEKDILRYDLDKLAMEMTGEPVERTFPIYIVFHHGRCRGYFIAPQRTVVYPTIHPEIRHLDEYRELLTTLAGDIKRLTGNPIFMLCARAEKMGERLVRTFKVKKCAQQAYEYIEDD
jgi:hypothetical protein